MDNKKFYRMCSLEIWPDISEDDDIDRIANELELKTIIQDFRTKDNTLSIWNFDRPIDAALGLISANNNNYKLQDVFLIFFSEQDLIEEELNYDSTNGGSLFDYLNDNHYDIERVNYSSLKNMIRLVLKSIKNKQYYFVSSNEVLNEIKNVLANERIKIDVLPKDIKNKLED